MAAATRLALTIRAVEEELLGLYQEGRLRGTLHTCVGQEWTGVAVAGALRPGDTVLSNHRGHGHFIAHVGDVAGLIAEIMGKATGICGGRGGSQHLHAPGFFSNGIIGGMAPVAVGLALANRLAANDRVVVLFLGDGGMAQGVVFEALNAAAALRVPLYVVCEANGIAQSTPTANVQAGTPAERARAFGIGTQESSTADPALLMREIRAAVDGVRERRAPFLHAIATARLKAHSKGDDPRMPEELASLHAADPLNRLLAADDAAAAWWREAQAAARTAVGEALRAPEAAPPEEPRGAAARRAAPASLRPCRLPPGKLVERIRDGLGGVLRDDPKALLLGEDIRSPYGGAFKATHGLSAAFPERVINTAISEAAIVGIGTGLALAGYRPICEIMFGDFVTLAFDQLANHAAKFRYMYNDRVSVPLIVRTPMGGRRGYGPTHSQSLEKHFLGIPGLKVAAVHQRLDAETFYRRLVRETADPVLVAENKAAYALGGREALLAGFDYLETDELFPCLVVRPHARARVTLLGYGGMLAELEKAADLLFERHEIVAEIVCPTLLYPFDLGPLETSVRTSGHLVVAEEGQGFAAFGAEAVASLAERLAGRFQARRVGPPGHPIPCAAASEEHYMPSAAHIVDAVLELIPS